MKKFTPEQEVFLACLRELRTYKYAARKARVTHQTSLQWRTDDPEFAAACKEAIAMSDGQLVTSARQKLQARVAKNEWPAIAFVLRQYDKRGSDLAAPLDTADALIAFLQQTKGDVWQPEQSNSQTEHPSPTGNGRPANSAE